MTVQEQLIDKAKEAFILAIEIYNKPRPCGIAGKGVKMSMPYLIRTDPKDPRGERVQIITFGEPTPIPDYCICDGCKNSAGCSWKPLKPPYTTCIDYKGNRR